MAESYQRPLHVCTCQEYASYPTGEIAQLIEGVLRVVREHRPLHLLIVGGEPLVRFRELNTLCPG